MQNVEVYINGDYVNNATVSTLTERLIRDEVNSVIPDELRGGLVEVKSSGEVIDSYYA